MVYDTIYYVKKRQSDDTYYLKLFLKARGRLNVISCSWDPLVES
jgi:hypothetical protein